MEKSLSTPSKFPGDMALFNPWPDFWPTLKDRLLRNTGTNTLAAASQNLPLRRTTCYVQAHWQLSLMVKGRVLWPHCRI